MNNYKLESNDNMTTKLISKQRAMQIARNYRLCGYEHIHNFGDSGILVKELKKEYRDEIKIMFRGRWRDKDKERVLELYKYIVNKLKKTN